MAATSSAQDMVRVGECVDLYYYDGETSKKQCFPTTQNTKYLQDFSNKKSGSSVFTIPPNNGIQDIVLTFGLNTLGGTFTGLALNAGWGYQAIKQVSFRYGGSSQFFLSGDQILQNALRKQPNKQAANDILTLGGQAALAADMAGANQYAAVVLTLPHSVPSGVGKAHPLPTDCLTQQVQITVELNPVVSIFSVQGSSPASPPDEFNVAYFQVQQVMFNNAGDALARRVDMAENAYAFPCEFTQQKQVIALANSASSQSVVLTGFRSGEVKAIHCWLTRDADTNPANPLNPFKWYLPTSIQMTYAGDIYARYNFQSSQLWNLINGDKSPAVDTISYTFGSGAYTAASFTSKWVELPFAQTLVDEDSHYTLVRGKPITNGIVNLDITTPSQQSDWKLNVSYIYNTTLLFSQGTCDYVF